MILKYIYWKNGKYSEWRRAWLMKHIESDATNGKFFGEFVNCINKKNKF